MSKPSPLRIFVAMPAADMGPNAVYTNPASVETNVFNPVVEKLEAKLGREVKLVIEMKKKTGGTIHESMFREATDADVYIADLTGANANVYLELGVRWALSDWVTVPITQSPADLKFNVTATRVINYDPNLNLKAVDQIVETIEEGLKNKKSDSPVRSNSDIITIPRNELTKLQSELESLRATLGGDLVRAALAEKNPIDRIILLQDTIKVNPASAEAFFQLGLAYRDTSLDESGYARAVEEFQRAIRLDPENALFHRELGVTYSKQNSGALAVGSFKESLRIRPDDPETWSTLGGALRRLGMEQAPETYNRKALEDARDSYDKARTIKEDYLYAELNFARITLLLSMWEPELADLAKEAFRKQIHLSRHTVGKKAQDPQVFWEIFNLGEILLFSNQFADAKEKYHEAVDAIPKESRVDKIRSVLGPFHDYLTAGVLDDTLRPHVEEIVRYLESVKNE